MYVSFVFAWSAILTCLHHLPICDPEKLAKQDPLATRVWKMYAWQMAILPDAQRMEDLTWRMM
jgi:GATA-binding protein